MKMLRALGESSPPHRVSRPGGERQAARRRGIIAGAIPVLILGLLMAPVRSAVSGERNLAFREVAAEVGLDFVHGPLGDTPGWEMHGGGTVGDFDGDGWPDLFLVGSGSEPDALFINQRDGTFREEAAAWGLVDLYRGVGANAADFDGDGDDDLFVTSMGTRPEIRNGQQRLYRNNGDRTFTDVAKEMGVAATGPDISPDGYGATWGDYDLDGDLDLWVGGWRNDFMLGPSTTRLFRDDGEAGFTDVTVEAGVYDPAIRAFGAIFADMDGDRYPELLVAGDFGTSRYFANDGRGHFSPADVGLPQNQRVYNGMGTALGDFDRDGRPDWFVSAIYPAWELAGPPGSRLYLNRSRRPGDYALRALPRSAGVNDGGWGWGAAAVDLDHDGWLDLVHTNGWSQPCPSPLGRCYQEDATRLFRNRGDGTFDDVAAPSGLVHTGQGRGLLQLDYDRDGDLDIAILENAGRLHFFRNDLSGEATNWLAVRLDTGAAPCLAPDGIGATVETRVAGGQRQRRIINTGSNYLGRGELTAHFGLGAAEVVERLIVEWPDGSQTVRMGVAANQYLEIAAGACTPSR